MGACYPAEPARRISGAGVTDERLAELREIISRAKEDNYTRPATRNLLYHLLLEALQECVEELDGINHPF